MVERLSTDITPSPSAKILAQMEAIQPPRLEQKNMLALSFMPLVSDYYAPMRWAGYTASALAPWLRDKIAENRFLEAKQQSGVDINLYLGEKPKKNLYLPRVLKDRVLARKKAAGEDISDYLPTEPKESIHLTKIEKNNAEQTVANIEFLYFFTLTAIYSIVEGKQLKDSLAPAVAAEIGKPLHELKKIDFLKSRNPLVQTGVQRYAFSNLARATSDFAFLGGLMPGILAQAVRITFERSVFNQDTAFGKLQHLLNSVQKDNFDLYAEEDVSLDLANVVQQSQKDHGRKGWSRELLGHYMPLFQAMATEIVNKKMKMPEVTYLLGELMEKRLSPREAMHTFNEVKESGLRVRGYAAAPKTKAVILPENEKIVSFRDYIKKEEATTTLGR